MVTLDAKEILDGIVAVEFAILKFFNRKLLTQLISYYHLREL